MAETSKDAFLDGWNRKWRTLWVWSQVYIGFKAAQARGRLLTGEEKTEFWEQKHSILAETIWLNISELRGWWVKVGQFLSTRSDLLPVQYITHLTKLQDMMPTSKFNIISKIIENELGVPINEIFSEFDENPLASASIGQVHRGKLLENDNQVVIKIQHPGVDKTLAQDMATLTQMTWAFGLLEKGLNFGPILDEWQKSAADELDFRIELRHQERARLAAITSGIDVIIPKCYSKYTTKRVMVMDYCEGFKITDIQKLKKYNVDTNILMTKICDSFAYQIHVDGFFNGDPHPGNILVQINSETGKATPVLLDWGLVKNFSVNQKVAFAKAVYSVANMDVMGLMAGFEEMGFKFKDKSGIDPEIYMDALRVGFFRDTGDTTSLEATSTIKSSGVNRKTVEEKNPIEDWPRDIIFFVRVASLLHGLSIQLKASVPFLEILVKRAEQGLCERYIPRSPLVYLRYPPVKGGKIRSQLEWKVFKFLSDLMKNKKLILGCQVAVCKDEILIVDTAVGKMGPTNSRPISRNSLFCSMAVTNGLLVTALLRLIDRNEASLDDPVCHWWDGFIRFDKQDITIRDILCHKGGMHRALPLNLRISQLIDYEKMISFLEDAAPQPYSNNKNGQYAYLTSGWLYSEVIKGITGLKAEDFIRTQFIEKFGLTNEIYYPLPKALLVRSLYKKSQASKNPIRSVSASPLQKKKSLIELNDDETILDTQSSLMSSNPCSRVASDYSSCSSNSRSSTPKNDFYIFEADIESLRQPLAETSLRYTDDPAKNRIKEETLDSLSLHGKTIEENALQGHESTSVDMSKASSWLEGKQLNPLPRSRKSIKKKRNVAAEVTNSRIPNKPRARGRGIALLPAEDVLERLTSCRREVGVARIDSNEIQEKLGQAQKLAQKYNQSNSLVGFLAKYPSKYLARAQLIRNAKAAAESAEPERGSAIELAKAKPHVLDPLIYDSRRVQYASIPPMNCRCTARGLAQIYSMLASGKIIKPKLLSEASQIQLKDSSIETMLLTGGGSGYWGLGYQLYPCLPIPKIFKPSDEIDSVNQEIRRVAFSESNKKKTVNTFKSVKGIGYGDLGGSVALCIPELNLSIAILLNDILSGPLASREILIFILRSFGLEPAWNQVYSVDSFIKDVKISLLSKSAENLTPCTLALRFEDQLSIQGYVQPTFDEFSNL